MKDYKMISKISLLVLLAFGIVISAMTLFCGNDPEQALEVAGDTLEAPTFTNLFLFWNYILCGLAVCVTFGFVIAGFVELFKKDQKKALTSLSVVCGIVLLFVVCWFLGSPEKLTIIGYDGTDNQGFWAQLSDMMMYVTYVLVLGTLCTIVWGAIYTRIKK